MKDEKNQLLDTNFDGRNGSDTPLDQKLTNTKDLRIISLLIYPTSPRTFFIWAFVFPSATTATH